MAMLPVLLDMVDEIYGSLENQSEAPTHFPLLFLQQRPNTATGCGKGMRLGGRPGCFRKANRCGKGCPRGNCAMAPKSEDFTVTIDVKSFKPEEIEVKVKDREIIIDGKHEERQDEQGFVTRQFTRRCLLPEEFDPDTISTYLTAEGKMTIKAEKIKPQIDQTQVRVIPIQHVATEAPEPAPQPDSQKVEGGEISKDAEKLIEE